MKKFIAFVVLVLFVSVSFVFADEKDDQILALKNALGVIGESGSGYKSATTAPSLPVINLVQMDAKLVDGSSAKVWVIPGGKGRTLAAKPGADFELLKKDKGKLAYILESADKTGKVGELVLTTFMTNSERNVVGWRVLP